MTAVPPTSEGAGGAQPAEEEGGIKKIGSMVEGMGQQFGSWMWDKTHPIKNEELVGLNKTFHQQESIIDGIEKQLKVFQTKLRAGLTQISEFNAAASTDGATTAIADSSNRVSTLIRQTGDFVVDLAPWKAKLADVNKVRETAINACWKAEMIGDSTIELMKRQKAEAEKVQADTTPEFRGKLQEFVDEFGAWRAGFNGELSRKRVSFLAQIQLKEVDLGPLTLDFLTVDGPIGAAKERVGGAPAAT